MVKRDKDGKQIVDDFSSNASYMKKIGSENADDLTSMGSYMVKPGEKGNMFDDLNSS